LAVTGEDVHPAGGDLHDEQHVQAAQRQRVDVEEVRREQSGRLRPQDLRVAGIRHTCLAARVGGYGG
jgi:hypothetical protein